MGNEGFSILSKLSTALETHLGKVTKNGTFTQGGGGGGGGGGGHNNIDNNNYRKV